MGRTYFVRDISERHGVSEQTVLAWIASGELRALNVSRRPDGKRPRWRVTQAALDVFEAARTVTPPAPRAQRRQRSGDIIKFY
jgi:hypothetical protein